MCDATCLLRNFNLVLQTLEATQNVIVCINLMDEAEKKGIGIHMRLLEERLGTPCVTTCARNQKGLNDLLEKVHKTVFSKKKKRSPITPLYRPEIEAIIKPLASCIETVTTKVNARWAALRLLEQNASLSASLDAHLGFSFKEHDRLIVFVYTKAVVVMSRMSRELRHSTDHCIGFVCSNMRGRIHTESHLISCLNIGNLRL